jgi:hypothetical protein
LTSSTQPRNCVSCGRSISWDANVCPYCGHDYRVAMAGPMQAQKEQSGMPTAAGILIILGALIYLAVGGLVVVGSSVALIGEGVACGAIVLVLGVVSILGGIFALERKMFALALIAGILTIPTILGLIGMILVAVSRKEFHS